MKLKLLFIINIVLIYFNIFAQSDTLICSLKGIEDKIGKTHIFYQAKYINFSNDADSTLDFIYHYNDADKKENLFLTGYSINYYQENNSTYRLVKDIDFINNDPNKYIYLYSELGIDGNWSVSRYDTSNVLEGGFIPASNLFVSKQDSNIVFIIVGNMVYKSFDGGFTVTDSNIYNIQFKYLTFSPFNDYVMFGISDDGSLVKSVDQGHSYFIVDQTVDWNFINTFLFDKDQQHIYALLNEHITSEKYSHTHSTLLTSDNKCKQNSWKFLAEDLNKINICIDDSVSGTLFYARGNEIFKSTDYGLNFGHFTYVENFPVSMYKKPNEDILYIANANGIVKVIGDSSEFIVRNSIKQALTYFPLNLGNLWVYYTTGVSYDTQPHPFSEYTTITVDNDSIFPSGEKYFLVKNLYNHDDWFRLDSANGLLYIVNNNGEKLVENFLATQGDEYEVYDGIVNDVADSNKVLWDKKRLTKTFYYSSLYTYKKAYMQGIGIIRRDNEFDFGYSTTTLKGCVINGIVYGDTTITGIEKQNLLLPESFTLSQNYPNPFNPSTTIEYEIPRVTPPLIPSREGKEQSNRLARNLLGGSVLITLKIYDILGREVATLVNKKQNPGNYHVQFDASKLSSGIYYYRLKAGNFIETKKMILLR